jgi:hypothetical protein
MRGDATGVGDAVDPCGQAAGDGDQRTVSIAESAGRGTFSSVFRDEPNAPRWGRRECSVFPQNASLKAGSVNKVINQCGLG